MGTVVALLVPGGVAGVHDEVAEGVKPVEEEEARDEEEPEEAPRGQPERLQHSEGPFRGAQATAGALFGRPPLLYRRLRRLLRPGRLLLLPPILQEKRSR